MRPGNAKRILIIGAGSIGLKHLRAFQAADASVQLAVIDPREEARARAREMGAQPLAGDWESVDLSQFDGVVICAPPPLHIPYARRCIIEGVPVLSEKPLSNTPEGMDELIQLAEADGAPPSGVAYTRRYIPAHEHVRGMIDSGDLGQMLVLRINAGQPFTTYRPDYRQIYYASREQGGGCMLDFASHFIDLAQWYMGRISSISGYAKHLALEGVEVEDTVAVTFGFDSGSLGSLHINQFQPLNENCIDICGQDSVVRIIEPGFKCMLWRKGAEAWETIKVDQEDYLGGLRRQAAAFLSAIDGGPSMRTSFRDAAHTLVLCLDVLKSS